MVNIYSHFHNIDLISEEFDSICLDIIKKLVEI